MDSVERRCWLDWWANPLTNLAGAEAHVTITSGVDGCYARGRLITDNVEEQEAFAFLCNLDPVFSLRFDDASTITVTVHPDETPGQFTITEYTGPAQRQIDHRINLQPSVQHQSQPSAGYDTNP